VDEIAEFLRTREPFAELEERALEELAERTEVESFPAGTVIFRQGDPALRHVRIIRRGSVELVDRGAVLDLLGEGEWFGHPAMLSGLPTGAAARAAEDTVCYRLAADDVVPHLARPSGLRFITRSLMARPRPGKPFEAKGVTGPPDVTARSLIREGLVTCAPDTPIRDAARQMAEARASSALVRLGSGQLGILTDHDLRVRVVAEGMPTDAPISAVMTTPAVTAGPDDLGSELMLTMIDSGVRHLPVLTARGEVVGVVTDVDLLGAEARSLALDGDGGADPQASVPDRRRRWRDLVARPHRRRRGGDRHRGRARPVGCLQRRRRRARARAGVAAGAGERAGCQATEAHPTLAGAAGGR
jgi:CBS domain-containing protein